MGIPNLSIERALVEYELLKSHIKNTFVPYLGAIKEVNLGSQKIIFTEGEVGGTPIIANELNFKGNTALSWTVGEKSFIFDDVDGFIPLVGSSNLGKSGGEWNNIHGNSIFTKALEIKSTDTSDPTLSFKTTNTPHEMKVFLDESIVNDEIVFEGQTASKNTQITIKALDGENATMFLQSGDKFGFISYDNTDRLFIVNNQQDENMLFQINDGGVVKTVTWNAADDKFQHSAGVFNYDDDNIVTTGNIGIGTTTPDAKLEVAGDMLFTGASSGLPFGEINRISNTTETTITTQNVYVQVTIFDTNGESLNSTPDHTNDHITITKAGRYLINCSVTLNSVGGTGSTAEMEIQKNNGNVRVGALHVDRTLSGGGAEASAETMTGIANLSVDDTIEVWIKNETNTQNYVVEDITLSLVQIGGA